MCYSVAFVCETLDMPPSCVPLSKLRDGLGDVHEKLAKVAAVLQQQAEAGSSKRTPLRNIR